MLLNPGWVLQCWVSIFPSSLLVHINPFQTVKHLDLPQVHLLVSQYSYNISQKTPFCDKQQVMQNNNNNNNNNNKHKTHCSLDMTSMYILYSATLEASPSHGDGSTTVCHRPGSKDHLASAFESNYAWPYMLLLLSLLIDFTEAFRGTTLIQCLWWPTNLNVLLLCSHRTQSDCYDVAREREALHRQVEELEAANAAADSELRPLKQTAHILRQRVFGPSSHPSLPGLPSYAVSLTHQHL